MNKLSITITSGVGIGGTRLAAFDAALWNAGIANYNLIKLSSIIPPHSEVKSSKKITNGSDDVFGNKLFVVLAENRESEHGRKAWAGIGWVQSEDGRGLFVEQSGSQEAEVKRLIKETLQSMMKYRAERFGRINYKVVGIRCTDEPVCALCAAIYKEETW